MEPILKEVKENIGFIIAGKEKGIDNISISLVAITKMNES